MLKNTYFNWIDSLKGFLIILVVWGHMNLTYIPVVIIYSFHMPLFLLLSGFLNKNREISLKKTAKRKATTLLVPYLIFALMSIPVAILKNSFTGDETSFTHILLNLFFLNGSVGWNSPLWYLVVLFIIEMAFSLYSKATNKLIIFIIILMLGFVVALTEIRYPLGFHVVIWGLIFYIVGNVIKNKELISKLKHNKWSFYALISILIIININFGIILNGFVSVYHNEIYNYWYFLIAAFSGSLAVLLIFSKLKPYRLFMFLGRNTMLILTTHYFFLFGFRTVDQIIFNSTIFREESVIVSVILTLITLLAYWPISLFVNKYTPYLLGHFKSKSSEMHTNSFKGKAS